MLTYAAAEDALPYEREEAEARPSYGCELTEEQWNAWSFDPLRLSPTVLEVRAN